MENWNAILASLIELLRELYGETDGFLEHQGDAQLWYNRGYANGMVSALRELGYGDSLPRDLVYDLDGNTRDQVAEQGLLPWGRAYAHGVDVGRRETFEVLEAT